MSDHSTGSSGSSSNSWTLLSPEEAAMDTAGPVDDGTESIGDVPSLSEEAAGSAFEVKPSDIEAPQETILSEEGHQVCQETSPELFEEGAVSGAEADPEICAPIIHATITTSPPDNDLLGAVPFSIATESSLFHSHEPFLQTSYEESLVGVQPTFEFSSHQYPVHQVGTGTTPGLVVEIGPASEPMAEIGPASEPMAEIGPASEPVAEIGPVSQPVAEIGPVSQPVAEIVPVSQPVAEIDPASEPMAEIGSALEPMAEIGSASEPMAEIGSASEPMAEIGSASEPVTEIDPDSELMAEIGPGSELVAEIGPAAEAVAEIGPASEPVAEIGPASEPVVAIGPASVPLAEVGPASEPVAEIGPASEPVAEIGPASEPVVAIGPASVPLAEVGPASEPVVEIGPASEPVAESGPASEPVVAIGPASVPLAEVGPASEPVVKIGPASEPVAEIGPASIPVAQTSSASKLVSQTVSASKLVAKIWPAAEPEISPAPEPPQCSFSDVAADVDIPTGVNSCPESSAPSLSSEINFKYPADAPYPETTASLVTDREEHESLIDAREEEPLGTGVPVEGQGEDGGLRQRHVHYPEELRRSSDEEDEEETEFKLPERKEEKAGLSMNHVIIGALVLLCLGSFFFSDDFDGSDLSDQELLEKLVEENKQISILEAQIQAQKEDLDRALKAASEKGINDEEYSRMKEELSALPSLKEELEALKARISELTQLTGEEPSHPPPGFAEEGQSSAGPKRRWWKRDELKRQQTLLEQSKTRLEGMRKPDWPRKWLRERLVEMHLRLLEQVDRMGKKDEWRKKLKGGEHWKKERSDGIQKRKDLLKKYNDEWEHNKAERKLERERRKQERLRQARPGHKHKHDHKEHHQSKDFWKVQEKKLSRSQSPPEHCHDVSACAEAEGLSRVRLSDFQDLLNLYLNKLQGLSVENKETFHHLIAQFFRAGIFSHDRMLFSEFAEDVADILEDLADVLMDDDGLEEEMEEFARAALWKFAA